MSSAILPVNFRAPIFWKLLDPIRSGRNVDDDDHKSLFDFSSRKSSFLCYLERWIKGMEWNGNHVLRNVIEEHGNFNFIHRLSCKLFEVVTPTVLCLPHISSSCRETGRRLRCPESGSAVCVIFPYEWGSELGKYGFDLANRHRPGAPRGISYVLGCRKAFDF